MKTLREMIRDKKYPNGFMRLCIPEKATRKAENKTTYYDLNGKLYTKPLREQEYD